MSTETKAIEAVWPDAELEAAMLRDVVRIERGNIEPCNGLDLCCHVRSLLSRVRELEAVYDPRIEEMIAAGHASDIYRLTAEIDSLRSNVRELEVRLPWLLRCEQAIEIMAQMSSYPRETAEQIVEGITR